MGFFTRDSSSKTTKRRQRPSLTDPPNVFYTPSDSPSRLPARPATAAASVNAPHASPNVAFSRPPLGADPPPGWGQPAPGGTPGAAPGPQCQPAVVVNHHHHQHFYIGPYQSQDRGSQQEVRGGGSGLEWWTGSVGDLGRTEGPHMPLDGSTDVVYDNVCTRFDKVISSIDRERYAGDERDLFMWQSAPQPAQSQLDPSASSPPDNQSSSDRSRAFSGSKKPHCSKKRPLPQTQPRKTQRSDVAAAGLSRNYFSKVDLYANSRLPLNLPPLALYMPTWPLLCLAAQHSHRVYSPPTGPERHAHVPSDWLTGSKAMTIKSVPADHASTIVFAIRGTASFMDWAVNLRSEPAPPTRFLDDPGNACHSGFLSVARSMVRPVASRLRQMLREDPGRAAYSLLITGHSAGGAVAALLYMHMISVSPEAASELNAVMGCFKRVHCVTFGTPPVSLLPLTKPDRPELRKSLFLSFVNEGDPVVLADRAYVRSLLELLASPPPPSAPPSPPTSRPKPGEKVKKPDKPSLRPALVSWAVPATTLRNAGRIVVLRSGYPHGPVVDRKTVEQRLHEGVVAATCHEEQLRGVVWGDPICHLMSMYAARVEMLAMGAVTARRR